MAKPTTPYPGLRPFEIDDRDIFFGRNIYALEVLDRLSETQKFVAVVGSSGSGKSSLVRARVIPDLISGKLDGSARSWLISKMRPGENPIKSLAHALANPILGYDEALSTEDQPSPEEIEAILLESQSGLVRANGLLNHRAKRPVNHFLLLDQFEELFRYDFKDLDKREAAAHFVNLIINAVSSEAPNLFVALTMRTEYLAHCSVFPGLTNLINSGLYVVPPLKREEMRDAIMRPAQVFGKDIRPSLAEKVVNDVGDAMDRLPIVQHAMMRTWDYAAQDGEIGVHHYRDIGGTDAALSRHADEIFASFNRDEQNDCRAIFKALSVTKDGTVTRRPQRKNVLIEMLDGSVGAERNFETIYAAFSGPGKDFLMRRDDQSETIDITHEALLRIWKKLARAGTGWIADEARDADAWRRLQYLVDNDEEPALLKGNTFATMERLWDQKAANPHWLAQYSIDEKQTETLIDKADTLMERSYKRLKRVRQAKRWGSVAGIAAAGLGLALLLPTAFNNSIENTIEASLSANAEITDANFRGDYARAAEIYSKLDEQTAEFLPNSGISGIMAHVALASASYAQDEVAIGDEHLFFVEEAIDRSGACDALQQTPSLENAPRFSDLATRTWPELCPEVDALERYAEQYESQPFGTPILGEAATEFIIVPEEATITFTGPSGLRRVSSYSYSRETSLTFQCRNSDYELPLFEFSFSRMFPNRLEKLITVGSAECPEITVTNLGAETAGIYIQSEPVNLTTEEAEDLIFPLAEYQSIEPDSLSPLVEKVLRQIEDPAIRRDFEDRITGLGYLLYANGELDNLNADIGRIEVVSQEQVDLLQESFTFSPTILEALDIGLDVQDKLTGPAGFDFIDLASALNTHAWRSFRIGKNAYALEISQHAVDLNPNSGSAIDTQGHILIALERYAEGIAALEKTNDLRGITIYSAGGLGQAYEEQGKLAEAEAWYAHILDGRAQERGGHYEGVLLQRACRFLKDAYTPEIFRKLSRSDRCLD